MARTERRRVHEDVALLAELGVHRLRLTLDWSWLQPRPGMLDGDAVEWATGVLQTARSCGVAVDLALFERSSPVWFINDGGFTDAKFAGHWWPRWVEAASGAFGDHLTATGGRWVPMDNPLGFANRLVPDDPRRHGEVLDTLVVAWRDAWRILRGSAPVECALGVTTIRPTDQTIQAAAEARRLDHLRWRLWTLAFNDGTVSIPGRADREVADLAGSCDVVGIIVPNATESLGSMHRVAEMGPDRPLAITLLTAVGGDDARRVAVRRFRDDVGEAAQSLPVVTAGVSPTFDIDGYDDGVITKDRELKDSAHELTGR